VPLLDEFAPDYEVWERHLLALPVSSERALEVALASSAAPDRIVRWLKAIAARARP
jgi:hypothetical protein